MIVYGCLCQLKCMICHILKESLKNVLLAQSFTCHSDIQCVLIFMFIMKSEPILEVRQELYKTIVEDMGCQKRRRNENKTKSNS